MHPANVVPRSTKANTTRRAHLRRAWLLPACALALCAASLPAFATGKPATTPPAASSLQPYKNFFVTGDFVAAGVALGGAAGRDGLSAGTVTIDPAAIPANAEVVAAYLYWGTVASSRSTPEAVSQGARFKKNDISGSAVLVSRSDANGCNDQHPTGRALYVYRADVLRFFPRIRPASPTQRVITQATGGHEVLLPNAAGRQTDGAGLVLVFRVPGYDAASGFQSPNRALRSIVLYDGAYLRGACNSRVATQIEGFYEASRATPRARLGLLLGGAPPAPKEIRTIQSSASSADALPIAGAAPPHGRTFSARTFEQVPLEAGAMRARLVTDTRTGARYGARSWGAVVLSTEVQDRDLDGLLDVWEARAEWSSKPARLTWGDPAWPLRAFGGAPLPDLEAMGANPDVQDLFVEIDYMFGADHTHLPSRFVLEQVASAFRRAAPRPSLVARGLCAADAAPGACPINVHFDVGAGVARRASTTPASCAAAATWTPDCAIIPASTQSRGGDAIPEAPCTGRDCAFPGVPGTVGWKNGFRAYRDAPVERTTRVACAAENQPNCEPRFLRNRKDIFRYVLFAHALGYPSPSDPTQPRRSSGVSDSPGGDSMITLGLWDGQTGSEFVQASTLLHELGHTLGLRHGGVPAGGGSAPNCKPNYQSVMNYLFQVAGLPALDGTPTIDFSRQSLPALDEVAGLDEAAGLGSTLYRARWYAPRSTSFLDAALGTTAVSRRCDGTPAQPGETFVRVDDDRRARPANAPNALDWNGDGTFGGSPVTDANFDGAITPLGAGSNDYATMDLRQVGARRSVGSESLSRSVVDPVTGLAPQPPALPIGGGLSLDAGFADLGYGDLGYGDLGYGDLGYGDLGYGDLGYGDLGYGDLGYGDLGAPAEEAPPGALPVGPGEVTYEAAVAVAAEPAPPTAEVVDGRVQVGWSAPPVGQVVEYKVYRVRGETVTPENFASRVLVATLPAGLTAFQDSAVLAPGAYTYFVIATLVDPNAPPSVPPATIQSGASNFTTVVVEAPPCTIRVDELVARDGIAVLALPAIEHPPTTPPRLTSLGRIRDAAGVEVATVWRLRNETAHPVEVKLLAAGTSYWARYTLAPRTDTLVTSPIVGGSATHLLKVGYTQVDVKAASPATFADSRTTTDPRCTP